MIMYSKLQDLKEDILYSSSEMDCIGDQHKINGTWYSSKYYKKQKQKQNSSIKFFALLSFKFKVLHNSIPQNTLNIKNKKNLSIKTFALLLFKNKVLHNLIK